MFATDHPPRSFAYELDSRHSQRTLERAVRARATVALSPGTTPHVSLNGCLVTGGAESLWVELFRPAPDSGQALASACTEATLELGTDLFLFSTSILGIATEDGRDRIEIARPDQVHMVERRRFFRSDLRASAAVNIVRLRGAAEPLTFSAALLNLSVNGLACLADRADADELGVDDVVRTIFSVLPVPERFDLESIVRSKCPAGTFGRTKIGVEFLASPSCDQLTRLEAAMQAVAAPATCGALIS